MVSVEPWNDNAQDRHSWPILCNQAGCSAWWCKHHNNCCTNFCGSSNSRWCNWFKVLHGLPNAFDHSFEVDSLVEHLLCLSSYSGLIKTKEGSWDSVNKPTQTSAPLLFGRSLPYYQLSSKSQQCRMPFNNWCHFLAPLISQIEALVMVPKMLALVSEMDPIIRSQLIG